MEQKDIGDALLDEFDSMSIHKLSSAQERFRPRTASEDFLDAVKKQETIGGGTRPPRRPPAPFGLSVRL